MIIDRVNLNHLRIFEVVYKSRSMTVAAQELHLTQSGVSQHMRNLEEVLGVRLFDRIKQRLVPTADADSLHVQCSKGLLEIEHGLWAITGQEKTLTGTVSIGIPLEFGHDKVIPLLGKLQQENPGVRLKFEVGLAPRMIQLILKGKLDFALIDEFVADRRVRTEHVYDEVLELCLSADFFKRKSVKNQDRGYFESLPYVEYESGEPLLRSWFQHHMRKSNLKLDVRAYVEDAYCISQLVIGGVGAGVLPGALLRRLQESGQNLHVFKGSGKPLVSGISLAWVKERTFSPAATLVMDYLRQEIPKSE